METAIKYRIYPNKKQEKLLINHFGAVRFTYNFFLAERKSAYETDKTSLSYFDNATKLTALKIKEGYEWLNNVNSQSLQQSLKSLDTAYQLFFKQVSEYPKFKKKSNHQSFSVPQGFYIKNNRLTLPKFKKLGGIKINFHLDIEKRYTNPKLNSCTISKNPAGEYYASFQFSADDQVLPPY